MLEIRGRTLPAFEFYQKNGFSLLENQVSLVKDLLDILKC